MPSASANYKLITPWQCQITPSKYTESVVFVITNRIACTFVIAQEHVISLVHRRLFCTTAEFPMSVTLRNEEVKTDMPTGVLTHSTCSQKNPTLPE